MHALRTILSLTLACVILASPVQAADLLLRERVLPSGPVIRLGEVAEVLRTTPAEAAELASLPLMPAPAPGTEQTIRTQEIRDLLVAHGLDLNDFRFDGATRITIGQAAPIRPVDTEPTESLEAAAPLSEPEPIFTPPAASTQQSGYRLVSEAPSRPASRGSRRRRAIAPHRLGELQEQLSQTLTAYVRRETGEPMMHAMGVTLAPRHATLLSQASGPATISTTGPLQMGKQRFLVSFTTDGGPVRFPVHAEVVEATPVVVAATPIARGSVITAANVRVMPLDDRIRLGSGATPLTSIEEAIGKEASQAIRPDQPLTEALCLPPTLVRRGDLVSVFAGGGGIRVRLEAEARSNGRLGETIEVEAPGVTRRDKQRLRARVVGFRELAVQAADNSATSYLASQPRVRRIR